MAQPASMTKAKSLRAGRFFIAGSCDDLGAMIWAIRLLRVEVACLRKIHREMNNFPIQARREAILLAIYRRAPSNNLQMKPLLLPIILLATVYCQAAPILSEEAKNHIGEQVSVRGLVEQVSVSKNGHAFLNFGG